MNEQEVLKEILKERGFSHQALADKLGYGSRTAVTMRLRGTGLQVGTLIKMLEAMDCELVVRSKLKDKKEWRIG